MEETAKTCIYCQKGFAPYLVELDCHICNADGHIEHEDDFMRSGLRRCWQCYGKGTLTLTENSFCDEVCREEYFEDQFKDF